MFDVHCTVAASLVSSSSSDTAASAIDFKVVFLTSMGGSK